MFPKLTVAIKFYDECVERLSPNLRYAHITHTLGLNKILYQWDKM